MQTTTAIVTETTTAPDGRTFQMNRPSLYAITAAHSSVDMQTGSLAVLLPLLLSDLDLNYKLAAGIITANNIIIAIMQPVIGIIGDRQPNRHFVWFGTLLTGLGMASVLWLPNYALVVAVVIVSGLGSAMFHPESLARARSVTREKPTTGVSVFFSGGNIGFALGPILATLLTERLGKPGALFMLVPTAIGLMGLFSQWRVIAASRADVRQPARQTGHSIQWGLIAFLILLITIRGTVGTGLSTFIPLYFHEIGTLGREAAAILVTVLALSGIVGTLAGGTLADRYGRRVVMASSLVIALAALYGFLHLDGVLRLACTALAGMSISAAWPIIVVMIQEAMPGNLGLAGGLSLGTTYAASGLGVAALGAYADAHTVASTMTLITLLPVIALVLTAFVPERTKMIGG
jgi:FSR family fosmidomycin resistance protein-like MFS transporter